MVWQKSCRGRATMGVKTNAFLLCLLAIAAAPGGVLGYASASGQDVALQPALTLPGKPTIPSSQQSNPVTEPRDSTDQGPNSDSGGASELSRKADEEAKRSAQSLRIERLVALGKLWALIKYFHPYLAYKTIDWDEAFAQAIPEIKLGDSDETYRSVVEQMLSVLRDPVTRVFHAGQIDGINGVVDVVPGPDQVSSTERGASKHLYPLVEKTRDGIFVIHFANCNETEPQAKKELAAVNRDLPGARGLVLDLRGESGALSAQTLSRLIDESGLQETLVAFKVQPFAKRSRIHFGYRADKGLSNDQFYSAFKVTDVQFPPTEQLALQQPLSKATRLAFIIDANSHLSDLGVALQHAGWAYIVAEPDFDESNLVAVRPQEMPGGLVARVRLSEIAFRDGTFGFHPNLVVNLDKDANLDAALQKALVWVRGGDTASGVDSRAENESGPGPAKEARAVASASSNRFPDEAYRILAAFKIWAVVNYFSPYKDLMPGSWDTILAESIATFQVAHNEKEYALAVAHMVSFVHDSHAFVAADALSDYFGHAQPPFACRFIDHQLVVTKYLDQLAGEASGVKIGDVLLEIDGQPVQMHAARLAQFLSVSTPQALATKISERIFRGTDSSMFNLTLEDRTGAKRTLSVLRKWDWPKAQPSDKEIMRFLPGNIGYVNLDLLPSNMVDTMFERFKDTKSIIFDMRGCPHSTTLSIAQRLARKEDIAAAKFIQLILMEPSGRSGDCIFQNQKQELVQLIPRSSQPKYQGKTVLLIDGRTEGAGEHLGLFLKAANDTVFIGSPTAGCVGTATDFYVPGGVLIGLAGEAVVFPDGRQVQREGLVPDVVARPKVLGLRSGKDEVLDKAIEYLRSANSGS